MILEFVKKQWKKIVGAVITLGLMLALLYAFRHPNPPKEPNEYEIFHGVEVASKQILTTITGCQQVDSKRLTEELTKLVRELTHDDQAVVTRVGNGCCYLIRSSRLKAEQLLNLIKPEIAAKRILTVNGQNAVITHAEPNYVIRIDPPRGDSPIKRKPAISPGRSSSPTTPTSPKEQPGDSTPNKTFSKAARSGSSPSPNRSVPSRAESSVLRSPSPITSLGRSPVGTSTSALETLGCPTPGLEAPDDQLYQENDLWGLKNLEHPGIDVHAEDAWHSSTGCQSIVVGVIDSGIDYTHPDLSTNVWSAPADFKVTVGDEDIPCPEGSHGYNALAIGSERCNPFDGQDNHGHGTHVAGIIGAVGNNAEGAVGVNWSTKLIGLKVVNIVDRFTVADMIKAIDFAIQVREKFGVNIRVLNESGGFLGVPPDLDVDPECLKDAIERAGAKDILFVASAGDDHGNNNDVIPHYPSSFPLPNLLSVTAIDKNGALAEFFGSLSNYGSTSVHLAAPGSEIWSTYPTALDSENPYHKKNGTSMAAPFVSGAAALMLSVPGCSTKTAAELKELIKQGVDPMPSPSPSASPTPIATGGYLNVAKSIGFCRTP